MICYKLFRKKNGKLYPLYVNASMPTPVGEWVQAEAGELVDGKVKSRLGRLAYRPGWHCSAHPIATHIGSKRNKTDKLPSYRPAEQVWAEVEVAGKSLQAEADAAGKCARDKCLKRIPIGGYYEYKTNPQMFGTWIIAGAIKVNRVLSDAEVHEINKAVGCDDLPRMAI